MFYCYFRWESDGRIGSWCYHGHKFSKLVILVLLVLLFLVRLSSSSLVNSSLTLLRFFTHNNIAWNSGTNPRRGTDVAETNIILSYLYICIIVSCVKL